MLKDLTNLITVEPAIALVRFGIGAIEGGQIQSDLLLWKICHLELNYTEEICGNLTLDECDLINDEVQAKANSFLMVKEWLIAGPALVWCLFAGKCLMWYIGSKRMFFQFLSCLRCSVDFYTPFYHHFNLKILISRLKI
jgi:hypothetical protein